jgi:putative tryptophan/tyrosine transport system substrate-binding protein
MGERLRGRRLAAILAADVGRPHSPAHTAGERRRGDRMRRREFIGGALLAVMVREARAETAKTYRIAILDPITPVDVMNEAAGPHYPLWRPLFHELRRLGYVEGQNLTVERYGITEYSPDLARKVVAGNPDVIFADQNTAVRDLTTATTTIPIVGIMVQSSQDQNLAHPGRNLTGVSFALGIEFTGKRLELLREMVPSLSKVGLLTTRETWERDFKLSIEQVAKPLGITVVGPFLQSFTTEELRRIFSAMSKEHVDALDVTADLWRDMPRVIALAQEFRLPATYPNSYFAQIGGLMAYSFDIPELGRLSAGQIDQILRGTQAGDIPIYQAEKFTLTINMKTAKALGVTVPPSLLAQADEVIE